MAATLQAQWEAVYGPTVFDGVASTPARDAVHFVQRVAMAMAKAAADIATEATTTANHANRVALSRSVLGNPGQWSGPFAHALAAQGLDQNGSTDAQISSSIASLWNGFAGAP